jgi:CRP/FNR family transcriptional regulator, anaerobic regulatory protein
MAAASTSNPKVLPGKGPLFHAPPMWKKSGEPLGHEEQAVLTQTATVVRFKKGQKIFNEGDPASALFSIVDGVIKLYNLQPGQREHIVRFMFANDLIGLADRGTYVNSAKSITSTTLYKMPTGALEARLRQSPGLEFDILTKLSQELRRTQDHARLMARHRASAKIAMFVQMLEANQNPAGTANAALHLPMTRRDIGAYVGISPEAVSRGFAELAGCGAIQFVDRRHLKIADRAELDAVVAVRND